MPLNTCLGLAIAFVSAIGLLLHARSERPGVSRGKRPYFMEGMPWVLVFHPIVLFFGFCAYLGGQDFVGSGIPGLAAWGVLWPAAAEVASCGRPYRVARLLGLYSEYRFALVFTSEHKNYRRKMRPLRPTEWKLFALVLPVIFVGVVLTSLFSEILFQ
ncbi:hypothetical protein [Arthrobacter crystallopoietes]|uniref:hypothetical protein n=1 Tax=Crystallibacter crystallopoietes TaxID=37928 RepID=UPI001111313D|nr:hypothetical protein [Arthrobacter crystallopoietes]QTG81543.1 hypothetical protein J5251_02725 [Arthrobacter crystallopoietes]